MRVSRKNRPSEASPEPSQKAAHTPHNALFLYTFGNVEHARPAIKSMLPAKVANHIDFPSLAIVDGHFVDRHLAQSQTDLLFSASIAGHPGLIYVLFEHQSSPDHFMTLRMLRYMMRIWEIHLQNKPATKTLPVIIPLVLHHSPSGWTSPVRFEKLLDIDEGGLKDLVAFVPRFGMSIDEVHMAMQQDVLIDEEAYNDIRYPGRREREEGHRAMLLAMLDERFGKVPAWAVKRVNAAKTDELVVMGRTILRAQTIADVVGPEPKSAPTKNKRRTTARAVKA